jgi:ketosteroid isomerase-like protein
MGRLQFTNETIDVLDQNNAYVIGKWELFRTADTLSGHYTLLWKKKAGEWVVVADHSS